jgi:MurNAc alpha-1-phosphate uridylyltransferase
MAAKHVAMVLAAGKGERMQPLTNHTPKPLLKAAGEPLIGHTLKRLAAAGCHRAVINCAHLGEQLPMALGDGAQYGLEILYSHEKEPLETAGGIIQALPLLNSEQFLVVNADVWCDYPLNSLINFSLNNDLAHLVMVNNPPQHPLGDFRLHSGRLHAKENHAEVGLTYSGIGLFSCELFNGLEEGFRALRPLLDSAMAAGRVSGELYSGDWRDIGTPERLQQLNRDLTP